VVDLLARSLGALVQDREKSANYPVRRLSSTEIYDTYGASIHSTDLVELVALLDGLAMGAVASMCPEP
jgi:hypothetical protein